MSYLVLNNIFPKDIANIITQYLMISSDKVVTNKLILNLNIKNVYKYYLRSFPYDQQKYADQFCVNESLDPRIFINTFYYFKEIELEYKISPYICLECYPVGSEEYRKYPKGRKIIEFEKEVTKIGKKKLFWNYFDNITSNRKRIHKIKKKLKFFNFIIY